MNAKHVPITKEQVAASLPRGTLEKIRNYMTPAEAASAWNISQGMVRMLLKSRRVPGARMVGRKWVIPLDTERPEND